MLNAVLSTYSTSREKGQFCLLSLHPYFCYLHVFVAVFKRLPLVSTHAFGTEAGMSFAFPSWLF